MKDVDLSNCNYLHVNLEKIDLQIDHFYFLITKLYNQQFWWYKKKAGDGLNNIFTLIKIRVGGRQFTLQDYSVAW